MQILGLRAPALDQKVTCVFPKPQAILPCQGSRAAGRGSRSGVTQPAPCRFCILDGHPGAPHQHLLGDPASGTTWRRATHRVSGPRG